MVLSIKVTCSQGKGRDLVLLCGLIMLSMRANGRMTKPMDVVGSLMRMATFMKGNGPMIRRMVMGSINMSMEPHTRVTGRMIYMTVLENTNYKMGQCTVDISKKVSSMERACSSILTVLYTMVILKTIN